MSHQTLPDSELHAEWAKILQGDDAAWLALVRRHQRLVYGLAIKNGLTASEAADCFQTVWVGLYRNRSRIQDPKAVPGWLATAAVRSAARIRSKQRRELYWTSDDRLEDLAARLPDEAPLPDEAIDHERIADRLRSAITRIDRRCRELLRRLFFVTPPQPYEQVAADLNMPPSSIGPTRSRCLSKLRRILDDDHFFRDAGISEPVQRTHRKSRRAGR